MVLDSSSLFPWPGHGGGGGGGGGGHDVVGCQRRGGGGGCRTFPFLAPVKAAFLFFCILRFSFFATFPFAINPDAFSSALSAILLFL